ncbi:MAG: L,D-transpeptidase [Cyanobacteria bacterium J06633_8]
MRSRLTLIVVCCSIVIGSLAFLNYKSRPEVPQGNTVNSTQSSTAKLLTPNEIQSKTDNPQAVSNPNQENSQSTPVKQFPGNNSNIVKPPANSSTAERNAKKSSNIDCSAPANNGSYMRLEPTGRSNKLGNPLYRLCLYARGQLLASYDTVNGRAYTQNRNRHKSGTQAPSPDGRYRLARWYVRGTHPEVGGRFLRMNQTFRTGRTDLGIHYDPSFEKRNGEDGTAGCIALTNRSDLDKVLNFHRRYRFRYIDVDIL